jgi:uncharacterized membrane protein
MLNPQCFSIKNMNYSQQNSYIITSIISFIILIFGVYHFAIKQRSVINGLYLGLCIYGIHNVVNLGIVYNWGIIITILNTITGGLLTAYMTWLFID